MAYVLRKIFELYIYFNEEVSGECSGDLVVIYPRVYPWPMMKNPFYTIAVLLLYLQFVLRWGPRFMEKRQPFNLRYIMIAFNAAQIVLCFNLLLDSLRLCYFQGYSLLCEPVDYATSERAVAIARGFYTYYLLKNLDLLDTVFFVLRKKQNQVTFLHVYHHTGMQLLAWHSVKYLPGGHGAFMGTLNCLVHVIMYFYYLLMAISPRYKGSLWWKKYLTQLQIFQFFAILMHWLVLIPSDCGYPRFPVIIMVPQNLFMFFLFADFYYREYIRKKPSGVVVAKREIFMATIIGDIKSKYEEMMVGIDPEIDNWLFMRSPLPVLGIIMIYLYFVLKLGPQLMASRKPFHMKRLLVFYNFYQVIFSTWLCFQVPAPSKDKTLLISLMISTFYRQFRWTIAWRASWWYFFSKLVELLDTVFFVLRKKQNQISFLHVYHHSLTAIGSWWHLKYLPGPQFLVIGFLNSFVHIVMYFYYMIAAMGPKYQKFLWWKKYLTTLQLAQFCVMLFYLTMIAIMDSKLPRSHTFFFITNVIIFLYLFGDFYKKEYNKKHQKKLANKDKNSNSIAQLTQLKDMIDQNEQKVYLQNKTIKNGDQKLL
ncbi:uncharacterized protein LOC132257373 [Phlebotomus argentipes]|uniref:uncharacterized protein LOC132257373 n=1 Tax=Phlebotomus argentipes TaxID=94469 RepID=UPI0028929A1B|nr:uncharacterized protein LOC132257373 [Phlebotomus argentipes]